MAEAFGIVGAAIGVAAEGLRLSQTLHEFVENVRLADTDIKEVADDVASTAVVLQQFEASLKLDEESMICTREFYKVTSENIEDCSAVFASIDKALQKSIKAIKDAPIASGSVDQVLELRKRDKFWWPFNKPKIENHRRNLDRLKANLNLKMQVMAHAREIHERQKTSRAIESEEKIKALRVEALALEAQEAERKYQEIKGRIDETQARFKKGPRKEGTATNKQSRRTFSDSDLEKSQDLRSEGQSDSFEGSSLDGPSSERKSSASKQSDDDRGQDIASLPFSKIEVLLSRIAGAQEAIVLATEKQGPPARLAEPTTSSKSEPLEQNGKAGRARTTKKAREDDLQQNPREPGNEHQRLVFDDKPLDRIARVQERLAGLTESPTFSHIDPFSPRDESAESADEYVFYTPKEGSERSEITEELTEPVQRGEDAAQSVTEEQSTGDRRQNDLSVARTSDRTSSEAESSAGRNSERNDWMIFTSKNKENDRPKPISESRVKLKGKGKQYTAEQMPHRPRLATDCKESPKSIETTADKRVGWAQRLTPSTGALVLYADRSTWVRGLINKPIVSFDERKHILQLHDFPLLSSSSVENKDQTSLDATALESQLPQLPLNDAFENLVKLKQIAEPSLDENEVRKSPVRMKKAKQKKQRVHQLPKETTQLNALIKNNGCKDSNILDKESPDQESNSRDQVNGEKKPSIPNEQPGSLPGTDAGKHEEDEDTGLAPNNVILDTSDGQNLTSPKQLRTGSDALITLADNVQASNRQGSEIDAGNSNAAEANNQDSRVDPEDSQSGSVESIIISYSRLARLRAFLLPRFIRRREISRLINDYAEDDHASTTSTESDGKGKRRSRGLRFNRRLVMLITTKRSKKGFSKFKRNVKTWFFGSRRLSSSSMSGRSYAGTSSYSYTYTESSDEEKDNQIAVVEPVISEKPPKSESREGISSRSRSKIRTNLPTVSQKSPSQENHGRDSQQQAKNQKPREPGKIADEKATEDTVTNRASVAREHTLDMPEVVDLDQPSTFVPTGFVGSLEMPILEAWLLRPCDSIPGQSWSWRRVRRIFLPLGAEELEAEVEKFNRKTKKRHSKPLWIVLRSLSSDQQQHIERLLEMKRACDKDRRFQWTLVALKVGPGASFKPYDSVYIQVIIKRCDDSNAWRAPIDYHMASVSRPLTHSDQDVVADPPEPPRRTPHRQNIILPYAPVPRSLSPSSSSDSLGSSCGSQSVRVRRYSSSSSCDDERSGMKMPNPFKSSNAAHESRQKKKAEQEGRRTEDRGRRNRAGLGDRGKEHKEKDSERSTGLGKVNNRIIDLEMMLEDHERRLEKLKTEESKKRSSERSHGASDGEDVDKLHQRHYRYDRRFFDYPKDPSRRRGSPGFQPLRNLSPYRGRDTYAPNFPRYAPRSRSYEYAQRSHEYAPRSSYLESKNFNPYDDFESGYSRTATALPSFANKTGNLRSGPRQNADFDSRDKPRTKPAVRFEEYTPSTTQDLGAGVVSSASNDQQPLDPSGPLFEPAGDQSKSPPSSIPPQTSIPSLNPTLNNLISQWTTLKLDTPKDKKQQQQQPAESTGLPFHKSNKGDEPPPPSPPQTTKPQQFSTYNEDLSSGSVPAPPPVHKQYTLPDRNPQSYFSNGPSERPIPPPPLSSYDPHSSYPTYDIPTPSSDHYHYPYPYTYPYPYPYPYVSLYPPQGEAIRPTDHHYHHHINPPPPLPPPPPPITRTRTRPEDHRDPKSRDNAYSESETRLDRMNEQQESDQVFFDDDVDEMWIRRKNRESEGEERRKRRARSQDRWNSSSSTTSEDSVEVMVKRKKGEGEEGGWDKVNFSKDKRSRALS